MKQASRFQRGSLMLVKNKTTLNTWFFRFYEEVGDRRVYRKQRVGTIQEFPLKRDAEKAVLTFRAKINQGIRSPETVNDLIVHYNKRELTLERKAYASIQNHLVLTRCHIVPKWGKCKLTSIRTVDVECWLDSLTLAPASKTKIKSVFSVLFSHAIRHQWTDFNPISKVRTSSKRLREKDVLTPAEFRALLGELSFRDRAMVLLAGSTGMRRSELIALTWADLNLTTMEVNISRSCVSNHFGETKTESSRRPVPLHVDVLQALENWRTYSIYNSDSDFLFPSLRLQGKRPISPDSILKKSLRPAMKRAKIAGKVIGWHSFRHTVGSLLWANGENIKTAQEYLRHANSRITMDVYTHTISNESRDANNRLMTLLLPEGVLSTRESSSTLKHPQRSGEIS